jgi:hypothetical protein
VVRRAALEPRRRRRGGPARLIVLALIATVVVLAVNSIVSTSAEGPDAGLTYADQVRPLVDRSTRQATALDDLRNRANELGRDGLRRSLDRLERESNTLRDQLRDVDPPKEMADAHGLLVTCFVTRAKALNDFEDGLAGAFSSANTEEVTQRLVDAVGALRVADQAFRLFVDSLSPAGRKAMPASAWIVDEARWSRAEIGAFVTTLRSSASLAPVHDVALVTVTTDPAAVGVEGGASVVPKVKSIRLDVVVANVGNGAEKHVAVEAIATSAGGLDTSRQFADLAAGQRQTVTLTVQPRGGQRGRQRAGVVARPALIRRAGRRSGRGRRPVGARLPPPGSVPREVAGR